MVDTKAKSAGGLQPESGSQKKKFSSKGGAPNPKKYRAASKSNIVVTKSLKVGNSYTVKVSALSTGSANIGLNEFSYGFPIYIGGLQQANASLGDLVQIQVLSIQKSSKKQTKFVIAKAIKVLKKATVSSTRSSAGTSLAVTIAKNGPKGTYIAQGPDSSKIYCLF